MQGKVVLTKQQTAEAGSSTKSFDITAIKSGSYFLKIISTSKEQWVLKFEKM